MSANYNDALNKLTNDLHASVEAKADKTEINRINEAIDEVKSQMREVERAANRPQIGSADPKLEEHKSAFVDYMRTGNNAALGEFKAMSAGSPSDGGYTIPTVIYNQIQKALVDISAMRSVARVQSISTPNFEIPYSNGGTASGWVGETDARAQTATSSLASISPSMGEIYAWPAVTQQLLEDSQFDIAGYIADEVATEFARAEGLAFLTGNGTKKPSGLLNVTTAATTDKAGRAFGTVQALSSSTVGAFTADDIINLTYQLKAGYRANAKFITNKATLGIIRTLKDSYGQYLWTVGLGGQPDKILGYDIVEMEDMPDVANSALPIAFGDFNRAYTIVDRVGVSMLYNPYVSAPYVVYQSRKRVGGAVIDTAAYKLLKIKAS